MNVGVNGSIIKERFDLLETPHTPYSPTAHLVCGQRLNLFHSGPTGSCTVVRGRHITDLVDTGTRLALPEVWNAAD